MARAPVVYLFVIRVEVVVVVVVVVGTEDMLALGP